MPPRPPAWSGSPASFVAPAFDSITVPWSSPIGVALANASFGGGGGPFQRSVNGSSEASSAPPFPSTAMWYVTPAVAWNETRSVVGPPQPSFAAT